MTGKEKALSKRKVNQNLKPNSQPMFTLEIKSLAEEKRKPYLQFRRKQSRKPIKKL